MQRSQLLCGDAFERQTPTQPRRATVADNTADQRHTGGLLGSGQQLVPQNLRYCCVVSLMPPPSVLALSRRPRASRAVGMGEQVPHATRGRGERSSARLARFSQCACWRVGAASAALGAAMAEEALSLA